MWKIHNVYQFVFLHCHTISYQCTAIMVGLSNTLLTLSRPRTCHFSSRLPSFAHFNTRHLFSRNLMQCPLTNFGQSSATLTAFYENILKKSCAGGRPAAKPLSSKFVTKTASVPDHPWSHARTLRRRQRQRCRAPCRRRRCTATGPAAEAAAAPP